MNLGLESGFDQRRRTTWNKEFIIRIRFYTIMRAGEEAHGKACALYQMLCLKSLLVLGPAVRKENCTGWSGME